MPYQFTSNGVLDCGDFLSPLLLTNLRSASRSASASAKVLMSVCGNTLMKRLELISRFIIRDFLETWQIAQTRRITEQKPEPETIIRMVACEIVQIDWVKLAVQYYEMIARRNWRRIKIQTAIKGPMFSSFINSFLRAASPGRSSTLVTHEVDWEEGTDESYMRDSVWGVCRLVLPAIVRYRSPKIRIEIPISWTFFNLADIVRRSSDVNILGQCVLMPGKDYRILHPVLFNWDRSGICNIDLGLWLRVCRNFCIVEHRARNSVPDSDFFVVIRMSIDGKKRRIA